MRRGFTLIELLAVIVILAIIALIATPIVLSIINDTKESASLRSAEYYLDAVEQSIMKKSMNNGGKFSPNVCEIQEDGNLLCDGEDEVVVEVKGEKPSSGTITFDKGKIIEILLDLANKIITKNENGELVFVKEEEKEILYTNEWEEIDFGNGFNGNGDNVWSDGTNYYYSSGSTHYIFNSKDSKWEDISWNGLTNFSGNRIWKHDGKIYYAEEEASMMTAGDNYVLNGDTWSVWQWNDGAVIFQADYVWSDGEHTYYTDDDHRPVGRSYILVGNTWERASWGNSEVSTFWGDSVWSDGENIYLSGTINDQWDVIRHFVLKDGVWKEKTWTGLTDFYGSNIWTDGKNIYYSSSSSTTNKQYVLNKETSTWSEKTWEGLTNLNARNIWSDGKNIYYSKGSQQYRLKRAN